MPMENILLKGLTILTNISFERPGLHFKLAELIGRTSVRFHVKYQLFVGKTFFGQEAINIISWILHQLKENAENVFQKHPFEEQNVFIIAHCYTLHYHVIKNYSQLTWLRAFNRLAEHSENMHYFNFSNFLAGKYLISYVSDFLPCCWQYREQWTANRIAKQAENSCKRSLSLS